MLFCTIRTSSGRWCNGGSYFTTFNNVSIFTMDTNIFKLHSYRAFLVGVLQLIQQLLAISWPLLVIICGSKNTVNVTAEYYMIECTSTVLLTDAVKSDASDVISEAWFYVATYVSRFLTEIWDRRCWQQISWHFLSHFQSENGNKYSRWPVMEVLPHY